MMVVKSLKTLGMVLNFFKIWDDFVDKAVFFEGDPVLDW